MKNKLFIAFYILLFPVCSILAQEDTPPAQEEIQVHPLEEEEQDILNDFFTPLHEKRAREQAEQEAVPIVPLPVVEEDDEMPDFGIADSIDNVNKNNEETTTVDPENEQENKQPVIKAITDRCSRIDTTDELWKEFAFKGSVLTAVNKTLDIHHAFGMSHISSEQQANNSALWVLGSGVFAHKVIWPLTKVTINYLPLLNSKKMNNYVNQYKNNIKNISELKKESKQITKARKKAEKNIDSIKKELKQIMKRQETYWKIRHKNKDYSLHTKEVDKLDNRIKQLHADLRNQELTVKTNTVEAANKRLDDIEKIKGDIKTLQNSKPRFYKSRRIVKGTLLAGAGIVFGGIYILIAGETLTLLFDGQSELEDLQDQLTLDTEILSQCLEVENVFPEI